MILEFLTYQSTIIKCYRDHEGLGWAQYDRALRRQAAVTNNLTWSHINGTLYSLCFAGKTKHSKICIHCLSDNHSSNQCPEAPPRTKPGRNHHLMKKSAAYLMCTEAPIVISKSANTLTNVQHATRTIPALLAPRPQREPNAPTHKASSDPGESNQSLGNLTDQKHSVICYTIIYTCYVGVTHPLYVHPYAICHSCHTLPLRHKCYY